MGSTGDRRGRSGSPVADPEAYRSVRAPLGAAAAPLGVAFSVVDLAIAALASRQDGADIVEVLVVHPVHRLGP